MRKSLTYKILLSVLALTAINYALPANTTAGEVNDDYYVDYDGETVSGKFDNVYGNGHSFTITGGKIINVYGVGNENYTGDVSGGNVTISGNATISGDDGRAYVYGGSTTNGNAEYNTVNISDNVTINGSPGTAKVYGGFSSKGNVEYNTVNISDNAIVRGNVFGGESYDGNAKYNTVNISGDTIGTEYIAGAIVGGSAENGKAEYNTVNISGGTIGTNGYAIVYGGYATGSANSANNNIVNISGCAVSGSVYGGWSYNGKAYDNTVNISNGTVTGYVYGGYIFESGSAYDNEVVISGSADITYARLFGCNDKATNDTGNTLTIDGWSDSTQSVKNFNDIAFKNISWDDDEPVLRITAGNADDLKNTTIDTIHIAGGSKINVGESMNLIESEKGNDLGLTEGNVTDTFTAGVARVGLGNTSVEKGNVTFNVNSIKLSSQAVSAAQTRAASAAFVNQGTDLISDSLDTISRDDNYGVKTFAAVHGNRSKYDVADDIKINGWSTIVGVGNADKFDNGSELSWGVFYENGSGNYRTYNSFNNEFFRGDGSMVYNGGGIAARYENKNGVYTEGSLRAGMLKNELDNAMRDVNGSYGYETESAYYGAHIGVGKIISLSDSSDLDIYGKFFHTYTEGDSVTIADDKFDFDSITSDRLRVGARITSNKENKFSTYYGLAYEYEFNGDADMTAQGLRADTQSLQGSSVMAEVGFNYQPTPDSPWSFDLNMRGYTGERQGGSFNVQATYTF